MSVIGYIRTCDACGIRMILTIDARDQRLCIACLDAFILDSIETALDDIPPEADDHIPPGQVRG